MQIKCEVVADSVDPRGNRLFSVLVTYPRIVHSEVMTHRMLSKNSASSRAIPFKKMVQSVKDTPFIPLAWQKDHSGMQGNEYFGQGSLGGDEAPYKWLKARDLAVEQAENLNGIGITKQLCNRLLEPFMYHTVLITGSDDGWNNFFDLRCPVYTKDAQFAGGFLDFSSRKEYIKIIGEGQDWTDLQWLQLNSGQAEIHIMALAEAIYDKWNESVPKKLSEGQWHIPFEDKIVLPPTIPVEKGLSLQEGVYMRKVKLSTAMAARTSYTLVGNEKEVTNETLLSIYEKMANSKPWHASPMEHCSRVMTQEEYLKYKRGYSYNGIDGDINGWCKNYRGFIQLRELIEKERQ